MQILKQLIVSVSLNAHRLLSAPSPTTPLPLVYQSVQLSPVFMDKPPTLLVFLVAVVLPMQTLMLVCV